MPFIEIDDEITINTLTINTINKAKLRIEDDVIVYTVEVATNQTKMNFSDRVEITEDLPKESAIRYAEHKLDQVYCNILNGIRKSLKSPKGEIVCISTK